MIYKIFSQDADTLLDMPETGMGYQIVNATQYERYHRKKLVVYNSDLAVELDSDFELNKRKIVQLGYEYALKEAQEIMLDTNSIKVLHRDEFVESILSTSPVFNQYERHSGGRGATDNPVEYCNGEEIFIRLSAYRNDKRIDFNKNKLKSGTFTTTYADYRTCVRTKDDPTDRYALPNNNKINWAFYIQPIRFDTVQRGIVQPAFNKKGGGLEAYFDNGTSTNTYLYTRTYGK